MRGWRKADLVNDPIIVERAHTTNPHKLVWHSHPHGYIRWLPLCYVRNDACLHDEELNLQKTRMVNVGA